MEPEPSAQTFMFRAHPRPSCDSEGVKILDANPGTRSPDHRGPGPRAFFYCIFLLYFFIFLFFYFFEEFIFFQPTSDRSYSSFESESIPR